jgi:hypothetical protein
MLRFGRSFSSQHDSSAYEVAATLLTGFGGHPAGAPASAHYYNTAHYYQVTFVDFFSSFLTL